MKKTLLFLLCLVLLTAMDSIATGRTWNGSINNSWIVAGNWTPSGVPVGLDDITFDGTITPTVTITDVPAFTNAQPFGLFSAIGNVTVNLSSASATYLLFNTMVLISTGSRVNVGASTTTLFVFGGNSINTLSTQIDGTLDLQGTGVANQKSYYVYNGATANAVAKINGKIILSGPSATIINSNNTNLTFENGSSLDVTRDGGAIPAANYKNGSTINVTGVTGTMTAFSNAATYAGLLIWNCPGQTISGSSAVLLPTPSYAMNSIRVVNTNTGSLRITTEPLNYTLGYVEVQGGTLEMSAPLTGNRTGIITTDLKITGGTVYGNAAFVGETTGGFAMTLSVGGQLIVSGGTLNLTNRPIGFGGACQINVAGDVTHTAGTITATSIFGSQNQLVLNGSSAQNLSLITFSGPMGLVINNSSTTGVVLTSSLTIPAAPASLVLVSGVVYTTAVNLLTMDAGSQVFGASNASYVDGPVKKIGNSAFVFPVGKLIGTTKAYVPIDISAPGAATDAFTAEYKRSNAQALGACTALGLDHVSQVDYWTLDRTNGTSSIDITLHWNTTSTNGGSPNYITVLTDLVVAHFNGATWDSYGPTFTATGTVIAGTVVWPSASTFSPFSIGSKSFANLLPINLNYLNGIKQNGAHYLNWKVTCNNNASATMVLERSADGRNFTAINTVTADALRCQQPFDHTDNAPLAGMNYYRLKMIDANGKITYSTIIALLNKESGFDIVNLVPTLVTGNAVLNVTAAQKTKMDIVITDMSGRSVQKIAYNLIAGSNQFTVNLANLSAGTYQMKGYTMDGVSRTIRFVKQ